MKDFEPKDEIILSLTFSNADALSKGVEKLENLEFLRSMTVCNRRIALSVSAAVGAVSGGIGWAIFRASMENIDPNPLLPLVAGVVIGVSSSSYFHWVLNRDRRQIEQEMAMLERNMEEIKKEDLRNRPNLLIHSN